MKRKIAKLLAAIGILASGAASIGCFVFVWEEPTMSLDMINKGF